MLRIEDVHFAYGQARVLFGVSALARDDEVVSLLGMNGAGKTTLLSIISGLLAPGRGRILLDGRPLPSRPGEVVRAGVVQVPEGRQVFGPLTVRENLEMGAYSRIKDGKRKEAADDLSRMLALFPILGRRLGQAAGTLSGGEQQMLAIARGLMARPRFLLLDEPTLGLSPRVCAEIFQVVRSLPGSGCGVLMVEQNALGALSISRRGYILTQGRIRFSGTPEEILADEMLREAFLGPGRRPPTTEPKGEAR